MGRNAVEIRGVTPRTGRCELAVANRSSRTGRRGPVVARFLASDTARRLFDDDLELWWGGPSTVVGYYLMEAPPTS
ncbi:MAG: hypothetical protein IKG21_06595 [Atopobiaceae bacterium]|nr:hypothetical protein [Atopobiaceae bacterium]